MQLSVRLLVFDLDGTLFDSLRDLTAAANTLLAEYGAPPLNEETIGRMVGDGAAALVARALAAAGIKPQPPDALPTFFELYDRVMLAHTRPYPGIEAVLQHFAGLVPMAVLTNKTRTASVRLLDAFRLTPHFFEIVGSDGPFPRKPAPDGLNHLIACARTLPDATLLVGDSSIDYETASAAGAAICLARYGFGYSGFPRDQLMGTEIVIDRPEDLIALVRH